MPGTGSSLVKQPTVSQSAKPGHLNGQCLREKSSYGASFRFGNVV